MKNIKYIIYTPLKFDPSHGDKLEGCYFKSDSVGYVKNIHDAKLFNTKKTALNKCDKFYQDKVLKVEITIKKLNSNY